MVDWWVEFKFDPEKSYDPVNWDVLDALFFWENILEPGGAV